MIAYQSQGVIKITGRRHNGTPPLLIGKSFGGLYLFGDDFFNLFFILTPYWPRHLPDEPKIFISLIARS
jgi:hypothetical protein